MDNDTTDIERRVARSHTPALLREEHVHKKTKPRVCHDLDCILWSLMSMLFLIEATVCHGATS